jgi:hypothetical protein
MADTDTGRVSIVALAGGIALSVVFVALAWWTQQLAFPNDGGAVPTWFAVSQSLIEPLQSFLPGLLAGWLAARRAVLHGVIVAIGATLATIVGVAMSFGAMPAVEGTLAISVGLVTSVLTQCVGAIAGAALRTRGAAV